MTALKRAVAFIIEHQISFALGFMIGGLYCSAATVAGQAFMNFLRIVAA